MTRSSTRREFRAILCGVLAALVAAGLVGCSRGETGPATLDGTQWRLVGWSFTAFASTDFAFTAVFEDGQVSGTAAVNSYGAPYTTGPDDAFSVGDIIATEMAGSRRAMQAEAAYFELLRSAASYAHEGGTLTLYGADGGEALVFAAL